MRRALAAAAAALALAGCATALASPPGHPGRAAQAVARPTDAPCNRGHPCPTTTTTTTTSTTSTTSSTTTAPTGQVCTSPYLTLTGAGAGVSDGGYYVHNNMWNAYPGTTQALAVCSYHSWNATTTATSQGGAVQTYPNVHKDYHDWGSGYEPPLANYPTLTGTWAFQAPDVGVYDVAWDIWLNGVPGNREVMIWTQNRGQTPAGTVVATGLTFPGSYTGTWDLWATSANGYLALVPSGGQAITDGWIGLRAVLDYLIAQGRVPADSTLGQIDFGVEVVDTGGAPATFRLTGFSITDS